MAQRKRRTRAHIIADLSFHHIAYEVVNCGFSIELTRSDYGYDATFYTYDEKGEYENGNCFIQLKATDHIERYRRRGNRLALRISKKDLASWADEPFPVYLIFFDAQSKLAYWVNFQKYLSVNGIKASEVTGDTITIYMDAAQIVDKAAVESWRQDKANALALIRQGSDE